ncbi:MAG: hypothetical protein UV01_C0006G0011 [Parcubacteria group bacterium GW2011_GWA2_42_14]|nr:MAG: hypothetical protein UV01_C0006G0011 [Parcubacteria group bacterium GW2011_GWA2_42_14]
MCMNDDEKNKKAILGVYEELKGLLVAIESKNSWFDDNGFSAHANLIIERVPIVCPEIEDVATYRIRPEHINDRGNIVKPIPAKAKLNSIIGRLKGLYGLDTPTKNDGNTFIQNQSQNQSQFLNFALELQEKIISEIPKYAEGTKERSFLEKLKSALPTIKSATDILSKALRIGADFGLDPATIHKLLGL